MAAFENKRVLITGGTSGIGLAAAQHFQAAGARVAITGSSSESVAAARKALAPGTLAIAADVAQVPEVARMAEEVQGHFGGVDILVANAGIGRFKPLAEWDEAAYDQVMDINVKGMFFTLQHIAPMMGAGGVMILTGSIAPKKGQMGASVYAASKGAVRALTRNLAAEMLERGIRVNSLAPGPIDTPIFEKMGGPEVAKEVAERLSATVPLGRMGTADEMAEAILYLASPGAAFMVGGELVLDGGKSEF